jgi:serine/threonine protein kinase
MYELKKRFQEYEIIMIMRDTLKALKMLHNHSPPLAHLGLKFECLHYGFDGEFKLTQFGNVRNTSIQPNKEQLEKLIGTIADSFKPPEFLNPNKCLISKKIDIWDLGIILYFLMYFKHPFDNNASKIKEANIVIPDNLYSETLVKLVKQMLSMQPHLRPSIEEAMDILNIAHSNIKMVPFQIEGSLEQRAKNFSQFLKERFCTQLESTIA